MQHYAAFFKGIFSAEVFVEFEPYVSGLIVSEKKTVYRTNRLFVVESRNQRSLNLLVTERPFSLETLNQARLDLLANLLSTQMKPKGAFSVDDTQMMHYG